jgi:murein DD-endopeptidase MepM/ murein hydrolase activator NlpD
MRRLLLLTTAIPLLAWALLPLLSSAQSPAGLDQRLDRTRDRLERNRRADRVLTSDISAATKRISRLETRIGTLGRRQQHVQRELDARRRELGQTQGRLRSERARLVRLRARLRETRRALGRRLLETYKADKPDVLTVVLNSDGFEALLERTEFLRRIADQDRRIVRAVGNAKQDAETTAKRLDRLERRQQRVATAVLARRDEVAQVRRQLVETRVGYARARTRKAQALRSVRVNRRDLLAEVRAIEREQAEVRAKLARAARAAEREPSPSAGTPAAGPVRKGTGSLIWPVNGPLTSPFGPRWGRLHAGMDISASDGTPIRAADSGRVVLAGWQGGYGNYTCIQHTAQMSTCYAHQSRLGTSVGANVKQGEVMGYVGNTGNSFGAHLHFEVRIGGSPVNPAGYL